MHQQYSVIESAVELLSGSCGSVEYSFEALRIPKPANILTRDVLQSFLQKLTASTSSAKHLSILTQLLMSLYYRVDILQREVQQQLNNASKLVAHFQGIVDHKDIFCRVWQYN